MFDVLLLKLVKGTERDKRLLKEQGCLFDHETIRSNKMAAGDFLCLFFINNSFPQKCK